MGDTPMFLTLQHNQVSSRTTLTIHIHGNQTKQPSELCKSESGASPQFFWGIQYSKYLWP